MSYIKCEINGRDVTKDLIDIDDFSEYNDETDFYSGIYRRGNINLSLDNNKGTYSRNGSIFSGSRENSIVKVSYNNNNPDLNPYFIFNGLIAEGSTNNDVRKRDLHLLVVDYLKIIDDVSITQDDIKSLLAEYETSGDKLALNTLLISKFLDLAFSKITQTGITKGEIGLTIESLFPPDDSFFDTEESSAVDVLNTLLAGTNSYSIISNNPNGIGVTLDIRPRATTGTFKDIELEDILETKNQTDGFNKLYNSISINESEPYVDKVSTASYGVRTLEVRSTAPPSQALADTYLEYYKDPKQEFNIVLRMINRTLDYRIGEFINLNIPVLVKDFTIQPFSSSAIIIQRDIDFNNELITLRLREL